MGHDAGNYSNFCASTVVRHTYRTGQLIIVISFNMFKKPQIRAYRSLTRQGPDSIASNTVNCSLLSQPSSNQLVYGRELREKEFRLLKLAPGIGDEPINCTLTCHNIEDDIPYIGLSYAWGLVDVVHAITCNDNKFIVSKNVYTALRNLRELILLEQYDRRVWIDGICINQSDPDEKTQQVRMMQKVYKNAAIVVAWLGEMTESDKRAFETLEYVSTKLKLENIYRDDEKIREESLEQTAKLAEKMGIPYVGHKRWADVRQLLDKPWFSRIWIIQEVLHARHFVFLCGNTIYKSELIFHFVGNFPKFPFLHQAVRGAMHSSSGYVNACSLAQWKEAWSGMDRYNLTACILKTLHFKATDPRDKIFALISLAWDGEEEFINYKESLENILLMVASYILKTEEGRLDLLSFAQIFGRVKGVPSWIPCWSQKANRHLGLAFSFSAGRQGLRLQNPSDITLDVDNVCSESTRPFLCRC